ncbi:MAG: ParB/RepB/Spo0J family partition protein [Lentisphaerota bacterium]
MAAKHIGLGRGLGALIKDGPAPEPVAVATEKKEGAIRIPLERIHRSPWQPRKEFSASSLEDLTHSVQERGILQPLLVRKVGDAYELIAGERRFRAAQNAELKDAPVIVMDVTDKEALELALIENLQREDLNLIEEAEGYQVLMEKFEMTQEHVAQRVGKGRPTIANALRLLALPDAVKRMVAERLISAGHAKVLLGLEIPREQELLAARVVAEQISVRTLERIVLHLKKAPKKPRAEKLDMPESHLQFIQDKLHQHLGTSVRVTPSKTLANGKKTRGSIEIDFFSNDDLDRLLTLLGLTESF